MQLLNFVFGFVDKTKETIEQIEQAKIDIVQSIEEVKGLRKKEKLDEIMKQWVEDNFDKLVKVNFLFKGALKKLVIISIPKLTQKIYDLIRTKIKGVGK